VAQPMKSRRYPQRRRSHSVFPCVPEFCLIFLPATNGRTNSGPGRTTKRRSLSPLTYKSKPAMSLLASSPVGPQSSFKGHTRLAFRHKLDDVLVPLRLQNLQQVHGEKAPHLEEDSQSERPLSSERLVLMSLDRISPEKEPPHWWQVALALDEN
jgi:hypothetical protein